MLAERIPSKINPKRNKLVDGISSKSLLGDLVQTEDPKEEEKPWGEEPIPWGRGGGEEAFTGYSDHSCRPGTGEEGQVAIARWGPLFFPCIL
jgi:hypothetical protein